VLPGLIEVMRWYDMTLLVNYWTENLSSDTTIISYGASLSFFYSISHAAKLYPLMIDPPENWVVSLQFLVITFIYGLAVIVINIVSR